MLALSVTEALGLPSPGWDGPGSLLVLGRALLGFASPSPVMFLMPWLPESTRQKVPARVTVFVLVSSVDPLPSAAPWHLAAVTPQKVGLGGADICLTSAR